MQYLNHVEPLRDDLSNLCLVPRAIQAFFYLLSFLRQVGHGSYIVSTAHYFGELTSSKENHHHHLNSTSYTQVLLECAKENIALFYPGRSGERCGFCWAIDVDDAANAETDDINPHASKMVIAKVCSEN